MQKLSLAFVVMEIVAMCAMIVAAQVPAIIIVFLMIIGNVFKGIDYNNIRYMIRAFNEGIINERCWECEVWFLCNTCFVSSTYGKEFRFFCPKKDIEMGLTDFLNYREGEYEKTQSGISIDSVSDYLEFLQ
jgi:hypothetical protein